MKDIGAAVEPAANSVQMLMSSRLMETSLGLLAVIYLDRRRYVDLTGRLS